MKKGLAILVGCMFLMGFASMALAQQKVNLVLATGGLARLNGRHVLSVWRRDVENLEQQDSRHERHSPGNGCLC